MAAVARLDLKIEPLGSQHDRDGFTCGIESLDRHLRNQPNQDVRRRANSVFVLVDPSKPKQILGFYTLCATALGYGDVPVEARKIYSAVSIGKRNTDRPAGHCDAAPGGRAGCPPACGCGAAGLRRCKLGWILHARRGCDP